jgi:hypothetical protein
MLFLVFMLLLDTSGGNYKHIIMRKKSYFVWNSIWDAELKNPACDLRGFLWICASIQAL